MRREIRVETVQAEWVAAVRARAPVGGVAQVWKPALDQVWAFLRANGGVKRGHNLFLYHHAAHRDEPMEIDFGVQVADPFEPVGNVRCIATPAGEVASIVHIGPYDRMGDAHAAIHAWCSANTRTIGPASWEIYGDWTDDPSRLETTIKYLLD